MKGQIRECRDKFQQTPALTEPVRAQADPGPGSKEGLGVLGTGSDSLLDSYGKLAQAAGSLGSPLYGPSRLGAIALPELCPLPQNSPVKYLSSKCPWIVLQLGANSPVGSS